MKRNDYEHQRPLAKPSMDEQVAGDNEWVHRLLGNTEQVRELEEPHWPPSNEIDEQVAKRMTEHQNKVIAKADLLVDRLVEQEKRIQQTESSDPVLKGSPKILFKSMTKNFPLLKGELKSNKIIMNTKLKDSYTGHLMYSDSKANYVAKVSNISPGDAVKYTVAFPLVGDEDPVWMSQPTAIYARSENIQFKVNFAKRLEEEYKSRAANKRRNLSRLQVVISFTVETNRTGSTTILTGKTPTFTVYGGRSLDDRLPENSNRRNTSKKAKEVKITVLQHCTVDLSETGSTPGTPVANQQLRSTQLVTQSSVVTNDNSSPIVESLLNFNICDPPVVESLLISNICDPPVVESLLISSSGVAGVAGVAGAADVADVADATAATADNVGQEWPIDSEWLQRMIDQGYWVD